MWTYKRSRYWLLLPAAAVGIAFLLATYLVVALRLPEDAPIARMYRTEADMAVLAKAVDIYHNSYGRYPPAGPTGLRLATDYLSRRVNYLPGGPPLDGWGRPYRYVPHGEYGVPSSGALGENGHYYAPGMYQLYSVGEDGRAGLDNTEGRRDNICNWDRMKTWRQLYAERNREYLNQLRNDS